MAVGVTRVGDVVVPEIFDPAVQNYTTEKTRIVTSGAVVVNAALSAKLNGGGLTFNMPSFTDLDNEDEDIMTDDADDVYPAPIGSGAPYADSNNSVPSKIGSLTEIAVRMLRHKSWSSQKLAAALSGEDPQAHIIQLVAGYWARRNQAMFVATVNGVLADNDLAPTGTDTHTQFDLTYFASPGGNYQAGVTDFNSKNFLRAALTMGDSQDDLGLVIMHSIVFHKAQVLNLIDFVPDAVNPNAAEIPFYLGRRVVVDDNMPNDGSSFDTWLFGSGAFAMGIGTVDQPSETERRPRAGGGAGQDVLHTRISRCIHPVGYAYVGTPANGGPGNGSGANNLAAAASWSRVYPERKQIKFARLRTRELA
jgi:hypothetical protein